MGVENDSESGGERTTVRVGGGGDSEGWGDRWWIQQ